MPKVFHVSLTKTVVMDYYVVGESKEEVQHALEQEILREEVESWYEDEPGDWSLNITDPYLTQPLLKGKSPADVVLTPTMGVVGDRCLDISDYKRAHPNYEEEIKQSAPPAEFIVVRGGSGGGAGGLIVRGGSGGGAGGLIVRGGEGGSAATGAGQTSK